MRFLLDTDICSYAMKGHVRVVEEFANYRPGDLRISAVTEAELLYGAKRRGSSRYASAIERFVLTVEVLDFGSAEARAYGDIRARLEASGSRIGWNDLLIAAHAYANKLVLVTNNEREFRRVPGLKIENWTT